MESAREQQPMRTARTVESHAQDDRHGHGGDEEARGVGRGLREDRYVPSPHAEPTNTDETMVPNRVRSSGWRKQRQPISSPHAPTSCAAAIRTKGWCRAPGGVKPTPPRNAPYAITVSATIKTAEPRRAAARPPPRPRPRPSRPRPPPPRSSSRVRLHRYRATAPTPAAGPNWVSCTTSAGTPVAGCTAPSAPAATKATAVNTPAAPHGPPRPARSTRSTPCTRVMTIPPVRSYPYADDDAGRGGSGHCTRPPVRGVRRSTPTGHGRGPRQREQPDGVSAGTLRGSGRPSRSGAPLASALRRGGRNTPFRPFL